MSTRGFHSLLLILLFLALTCLLPNCGYAASPSVPLVAVILPRDNARFQEMHSVFLSRIEKSIPGPIRPKIYAQSPNPDIMSLRNSIRKATALGADLIIVYGTRAATTAKQEDFTEPLIFADVFDPVAMGLVPSASRGAPLVTGVIGNAPVQTLLKALNESIGTSQLAVPVEPKNAAGLKQVEALRKASCRRGGPAEDNSRLNKNGEYCSLEVVPSEMQSVADVSRSLKKLSGKINAVFLTDILPTDEHVAEILNYAAQSGLPVASQIHGTADKGAFLTLESDPVEQGELLAEIVVRVLDGELPEDIAPMVPRRVALTVNLAVAKQLGIQVPFTVLTQTGRAIR